MFRVNNSKAKIIQEFTGTSNICLPHLSLFFKSCDHFLAAAKELMQSVRAVLQSLKIIWKTCGDRILF